MFPTKRGFDWIVNAGAPCRPKVVSLEQAAGALRAYTLGVNEVGISFLQATRKRGDDFEPLSWRHEAHPLNRGRFCVAPHLSARARFRQLTLGQPQETFLDI